MKTVAIIQARMGSTRFPGKVAADLCGKPVLRHVIDRCRSIQGIDDVIVAEGGEGGDAIYKIAMAAGARVVFGPEDDVLARYVLAADRAMAGTIMRITADCPLLDHELCSQTLELYRAGGCRYAAIDWPGTYPKGYGCEVFGRLTLDIANELAIAPLDREHVTPWMKRNVRCKYLTHDKDESHINYCIDYPEDLERLRAIIGGNKT